MRSIFLKVLLWSLGTFLLSLVAFWPERPSSPRVTPTV